MLIEGRDDRYRWREMVLVIIFWMKN